MKVLFWIPPWAINGDPLYFKNSFEKHLSIQANQLTKYAEVSFILPEYYLDYKSILNDKVDIIPLPLEFDYMLTRQYPDIYNELYKKNNEKLVGEIENLLNTVLTDTYDVILTWENPISFFYRMYPNALIINQMPGIFSRAPYPHTIIFDPSGLYNDSVLSINSSEILKGSILSKEDLSYAEKFKEFAWLGLLRTEPTTLPNLLENIVETKIKLLPLQTSHHYAFKVDTGFNSQLDYLYTALEKNKSDHAIIATQYVSRHYKDTPLSESSFNGIKKTFGNLYFTEDFNQIERISQYLLPYVDTVISATSSLGLQGFCLGKQLEVIGNSYQKNYATENSMKIEDSSINTLAFILNYHQVLADSIINDAQFLYNLLCAMLKRCRNGQQGIGQLVNFSEIDKHYKDKCLLSFRESNTQSARLKVLDKSLVEEQKQLNEYRRLISEDNVKVISFDIFDTLIKRGVEKPVDVFKLIDAEVKSLTKGLVSKFSQLRAIAEQEARELFQDKDEITLDDIYIVLADLLGVNKSVLTPVLQYEIETEIKVSSARTFGFRLYKIALQTGKKIILTSDMYLPLSAVNEILLKANISEYDKIYLSSEHNATKKSGALYDYILKDLNITPIQLLHIGDNKTTDINSAKSKGIQTFRWSSAIEWLRVNKLWKNIYPPRERIGTKERSILAGLTAIGLYDSPKGESAFNSLTDGKAYNFGYAILAPMLLGYTTWLRREALSKGITDLYFLSREGFIIKKFYDILYPNDKKIKSHYLYCSRRSIRVASLKSKADILALASEPYTPGVVISSLLQNRFGINVDGRTYNKKLTRSSEDILYWNQICLDLEEEILSNAKYERNNYLLYLGETKIVSASRPAVVDIGWNGNMQGYLSELLQKNIYGFYYATLSGIEYWQLKGINSSAYLGENLPNYYESSVVKNRHFLEYVVCHSAPSFLYMATKDKKLVPKFRKEDGHLIRKKFITSLHNGAISFVEEFVKHFENEKESLRINYQLAEMPFSYFMEKPNKIDAELFQGCFFEDGVGGIEKRYLIAPLGERMVNLSVWAEGAKILYKDLSSKNSNQKNSQKNKVVSKERQDKKTFTKKSAIYRIESWFIKKFMSDKKKNKYDKGREQFFIDSSSKIVQLYYKITN